MFTLKHPVSTTNTGIFLTVEDKTDDLEMGTELVAESGKIEK